MEDSKIISILAVANSQDAASSLLNLAIPGLSTSDNQEWTVKEGDFTVKAYIKYPGTDIHRRGANWLDILLVSVPEGNEFEREVLSYAANRKDAKYRFLVDSDTSRSLDKDNITVIDAGSFAGQLRDYATDLAKFNAENKDEAEIDYHINRQKFNIGRDDSKVDIIFKLYKKAFKIFGKITDMLKTFSLDTEKGKSEGVGKFSFAPEDVESNGIGILFDLFVGDKFDEENLELPLIVRDSLLTFSFEFFAKSEEGAETIIKTFEIVKQMMSEMTPFVSQLENLGFSISFSKNQKSAFIDFTLGGFIGEAAINTLRAFNFQSFKFSMTDELRIQTGLNFKDLYENPDLENILTKLGTLTIKGDGKFVNFRTLCHFIRELAKYVTSDDKKKQINLISYFGLILSAFESFGLELSYDSKDVKTVGFEIADGFLGEEGSSKAMIDMGNQQFSEGIIPMVLGTIEGVKPMLEPFMPGLKELDLDKICFEAVCPGIRAEYKGTLLLPGLTEFLNNNVTN